MTGKARNGDGTIFTATRADGTTVYKVEIIIRHKPNGRPIRTRRTAKTLSEAKTILKRLHAEKLEGRATVIRPDTVLTYGLDWIHNVKAMHVRPSTAYDYEDRLRRTVAPYLGHVRLVDLTARQVEQWMADLHRAGLHPLTINGARQVLNAMCKHAARTGVIPHNPVASTDPIRRPPGGATRVREAWTVEEAARVVEASRERPALEVFVALMLYAGLRPGEAMGLRWCDVDAGALQVTGTLKQERRILPDGKGVVRTTRNAPKTAASWRLLPMHPALKSALDRQQMRQSVSAVSQGPNWHDEGYVVTSRIGTPVSASNLRRMYKAFLSDIGVRYIRLHDLRHTAATLALNDGDIPIEKVSQALGHTRIDTTKQIHARNLPRYNEAFTEGLDRVLPGPPSPAVATPTAAALAQNDDHA